MSHTGYGWDYTKSVPKVKDLVVITDTTSEHYNRVARLILDENTRQTVTVGLDLSSEYGTHVLLYRKDVRALDGYDKVFIKST